MIPLKSIKSFGFSGCLVLDTFSLHVFLYIFRCGFTYLRLFLKLCSTALKQILFQAFIELYSIMHTFFKKIVSEASFKIWARFFVKFYRLDKNFSKQEEQHLTFSITSTQQKIYLVTNSSAQKKK